MLKIPPHQNFLDPPLVWAPPIKNPGYAYGCSDVNTVLSQDHIRKNIKVKNNLRPPTNFRRLFQLKANDLDKTRK